MSRLTQSIHYLLRSSSLSSPRWYHLQSLIYFKSLPMSSFLTWSLSVWPHVHLHISVSVTSSLFACELVIGTVSIPYSIAGWTIILWIFPVTCGGTLLSHWTPAIFPQLFHPHGVLLFTSVFISPSLCRMFPRYLNSMTCGSWSDCILTLPNGVPFRHLYSVFALHTFIPLVSKASLHYSSSNSSKSFSLAHITTSSANITCQGASFPMLSVSESIMMATRKGLKADPWWRPTSTAKGSFESINQ